MRRRGKNFNASRFVRQFSARQTRRVSARIFARAARDLMHAARRGANCECAFTTKLVGPLCLPLGVTARARARAELTVTSERIYERALTNLPAAPFRFPRVPGGALPRAGASGAPAGEVISHTSGECFLIVTSRPIPRVLRDDVVVVERVQFVRELRARSRLRHRASRGVASGARDVIINFELDLGRQNGEESRRTRAR